MLPMLAAEDLLDGAGPGCGGAAPGQRPLDLESALDGADHVQENTPEDLEVKRAIFARLDRLAPSRCGARQLDLGYPAVALHRELAGRHRCLVVHPINPPYLIPAVEMVPAPWTPPDIVERTRGV